ncbi:hypothetical protein [Afifella pfennigii]|uniref:hypothetical protein n=1 Tax=Afifella pfennigii TaxID=209897 RepID=UPI0005568C2F|nr:hypothetical protein [Afifella pfennigii]
MPFLVRFLVRHALIGSLIGWSFLAILFAFDTGGLFTLIMNAASPWLPLLLLAVFFAITFGSAAVASAVLMGLDGEEGTPPGRRSPFPAFLLPRPRAGEPQAVPVRASGNGKVRHRAI